MRTILKLFLVFVSFSSASDQIKASDFKVDGLFFSGLLNFVHVIEWYIEGESYPKIFNNNGNPYQRNKDLKMVAMYGKKGLILFQELQKIDDSKIGVPKHCLRLRVKRDPRFQSKPWLMLSSTKVKP